MVELHGNITRVKCSREGTPVATWDEPDDELPPRCAACGAYLRPDVVWFEELLPAAEFARAEEAARRCDALLVVGTSAEVYPAAALPEYARRGNACVIEINPNETALTAQADHALRGPAGVMLPADGSVDATDASVWDTTLAVNVKGVAFGCKFGVPAMIAGGGGSIINVASFVAWMGAATSQTAYTASKGAVLAMTREIAVEYARQGIRCNALCPGPIETPLLMELLSTEEKRQRRLVHIPMGRLGQAEELAKAALFLASDDSSYMTGASLIVDGGLTAAYVTPVDEG
jgi:NAD(P)-dependent dehydrogenase (short-subunit alcohol dehydrogenase family)